ncbi:hypothetical protein B0H14DRAFT_3489091 [Mycena olivaceomarginata]|nr:hypothetical protein B0H14DRAFT_3489091 [Mycena olivaceomarginata]
MTGPTARGTHKPTQRPLLTHIDARASIVSSLTAVFAPSPFHSTFHPDPETPASATSFATSSGSGLTRAEHALLHLGCAEHSIPRR